MIDRPNDMQNFDTVRSPRRKARFAESKPFRTSTGSINSSWFLATHPPQPAPPFGHPAFPDDEPVRSLESECLVDLH